MPNPLPSKNGVSSIRIPLKGARPGTLFSAAVKVEPPKPRSLTAASRKLEQSTQPGVITNRPAAAGWQCEAWAIYDQVGELRYAANLYANGLSRIRLELTREVEHGDAIRLCDLKEDQLTDLDKVVKDVLADFTADQDADEMQRLWGLNKFISGEAVLVGVPARRKGKRKLLDYSWKVYSPADIVESQGKIKVAGVEYDSNDVLQFRVWQPHPRRSNEADSPVRATLPILRELIGLTMHVSAIIDSRLAGAGILLLPTSATVLGGTAPEDDTEEDPTVAALIESMIVPIKDRDSAASLVPLIMTAPDESVDAIRHISFASPLEAAAKDLRDEAIRRLALGLDMPPEQLLGLGSSSHWNAWAVQEDTVRLHLVPGAMLLADAIVKEFLHPVLLELGYSEEEVEQYNFEAVADQLISRPNNFDQAFELYKVDGLKLQAVLTAGGFDLNDAPEKQAVEDRATDLALKAVGINPSLLQDPGLPNLVSQFRAVLAGQDGSDAPIDALPPSQRVSDGNAPADLQPGPKESNTPDPDRPNTPGPPRSSPAGPDKA